MTFLPIAIRELRVASRRNSAYWFRSGMALASLVTALWIFQTGSSSFAPPRLGMSIFTGLVVLSAVFALAAGSRSASDCLSVEKREGTLGLLFLTDLKGYDIVMGKLAASSINSIYGLLSVIPILALPLLLGGVSFVLFWQVVLALVNCLFFSLAAGIFASSCSRNDRTAAGISLAIVLLFALGTWVLPPLIGELFGLGSTALNSFAFLFLFSPVCPMASAFGGGMPGATGSHFLSSLAATHCLGWVFIGLACWITPRSWQDRPAGASKQNWRVRLACWTFGSEQWRLATRRRILDINAYQWLSSRKFYRHTILWSVLVCEGVVTGYFILRYGNEVVTLPASIFVALVINTTLKMWVASESCRQLIDERRQNSLELILSTPMTVREIMSGQFGAMRELFGVPLLCVLLADFTLMLCSLSGADGNDLAMCAAVFISGMVMLAADCLALVWVGMWLGLTSKNPKRASGGAAWRILVIPTLIWIVVVSGMRGGSPEAVLFFWVALGLLADGLFAAWAYARLSEEFRRRAMERYQPPKPGILQWLLKGNE